MYINVCYRSKSDYAANTVDGDIIPCWTSRELKKKVTAASKNTDINVRRYRKTSMILKDTMVLFLVSRYGLAPITDW